MLTTYSRRLLFAKNKYTRAHTHTDYSNISPAYHSIISQWMAVAFEVQPLRCDLSIALEIVLGTGWNRSIGVRCIGGHLGPINNKPNNHEPCSECAENVFRVCDVRTVVFLYVYIESMQIIPIEIGQKCELGLWLQP